MKLGSLAESRRIAKSRSSEVPKFRSFEVPQSRSPAVPNPGASIMKFVSTEVREHVLGAIEAIGDGARSALLIIRDNVFLVAVVLALFVAAIWYAEPMPPFHVVMSSGSPGSSYELIAKQYEKYFAEHGVRLEVRPSNGAIENLKRIMDQDDATMATFIQGGVATGDEVRGLLSLGSVDYEPVWFFYRQDKSSGPFFQIKDYLDEPIALGNEGSGTRVLASKLLKITGSPERLDDNPNITSMAYEDYAPAFHRGTIKAVFVVDGIESATVQSLLNNPDVHIADFVRSDAFTRLLPFLQELILPMGGLDLVRNIPEHEIKLIATTTNLVIDKTLHPAIQMLFLQAAQRINGGKSFFAKQDEFPSVKDGTIAISDVAREFYANGVPTLMNYLPFWLGAFLGRLFWLLLPFATLGAFAYPLVRWLPSIRADQLRNQINAMHLELNAVEIQLLRSYDPTRHAEYVERLEHIETDSLRLKVIPSVALDYSSLRGAIESLRDRLRQAQDTHRANGQPVTPPDNLGTA